MQNRWILIALICCLVLCGLTHSAFAQSGNEDVTDYWGAEKGEELVVGSHQNIILDTDNVYVKLACFFGLAVAAYTIFWLIFTMLIKDRSPASLFSICFFGFMIAMFGAGFICFSEYTLSQGYNKDSSYLPQLQWTYIVAAALVWLIFSFLLTKILKGRS